MSYRAAPRFRSLAAGGAIAAFVLVGGGTALALNTVESGDQIALTQNATPAATMAVGKAVSMDLKPVVTKAAGGTLPSGTEISVTGLPDGVTQNGWIISGTPTRAGTYDVLVTVSALGQTQSKTVQLVVSEAGGDTSGAATPTSPTPSASATPSDPAATASITPATSAAPSVSPTTSATPTGTTGTDLVPALCSVLSGTGDKSLDGAALAAGIAPLLGMDSNTPVLSVILSTLTGLLSSVLGGDGAFGSAGNTVCPLVSSLSSGAK